jgi:ammonium transporter, Amt family
LDAAGGGIAFWAVGYAFAYGGDLGTNGTTFVGNQGFFLKGDEFRFENWFFQFAFASVPSCTSCTSFGISHHITC